MKRFLFLLLAVLTCFGARAQRVTLMLHDETLASALRQIDHAQRERRIVFVLNDLDSLRVTRNVLGRTALEAVTEVCEGYPILISERDADILVEYVRPPVRLLPTATITRRHLHYDADGYTLRPHRAGMTGRQLLAFLPHLSEQADGLRLDGQAVEAYYVDGVRLTDADELRQIASEMIDEVRVDRRTRSVRITLRQPRDGGFYGSLMAEADCYRSSAVGGLGGVWYSRYGKTSVYNRFGASMGRTSHDIRQDAITFASESDGSTSAMASLQESRLTTGEEALSNRLSLSRELSEQNTIGLSYYVASHRGNAQVRREDGTESLNFSGRNRHVDQEVTLRYNSTFGPHDTRFEALADFYARQTTSQNVSLYGAGVGTEVGESPSIVLWKLAAEVHHPLTSALTLHGSGDLRYLFGRYDPQLFLSNFTGSPTFLYAMDQYGLMLKGNIGLSARWQRWRMETGLGLQSHVARQTILDAAKVPDDVRACNYRQQGLYPYLQLYRPLDDEHRHLLTLGYQRDLSDIPYAALSPAVRWSDAFNYSIGNRELRSPEVQRWMVSASGWEGRYSLSASYLSLRNEIYWQTAISSGQTYVFYSRPINLGSTRLLSLQAEANLQPADNWQMKLVGLWQLRPEDETIGEEHFHARRLRRQYSWLNVMDYGQGWKLLLNASLAPRYQIYDRTYHSRSIVGGELQKSFDQGRLQCALTFRAWGSNNHLDRQIGRARVSYRYEDAQPHIGLRASWKFDGGRSVKVGTVEGGQRYDDISDQNR